MAGKRKRFVTSKVLIGAFIFVLSMSLAGCAQQQSTSSSSAGAASHIEAPAPTAEITDVATVAYLGPEGYSLELPAALVG